MYRDELQNRNEESMLRAASQYTGKLGRVRKRQRGKPFTKTPSLIYRKQSEAHEGQAMMKRSDRLDLPFSLVVARGYSDQYTRKPAWSALRRRQATFSCSHRAGVEAPKATVATRLQAAWLSRTWLSMLTATRVPSMIESIEGALSSAAKVVRPYGYN